MHIRPVTGEADWTAAQAIRQRVFVEEQGCAPEEEWDEHDPVSRHVLGMVEGEAAGTARWRAVRHSGQPAAKLERFAVLPEYRGRGFGRQLVRCLIEDARRAGFAVFVLHAQAHLQDFYAPFGFRRQGDVFEEAGIPHVEMVLEKDGEW